jgi:hypothetical protein
MQWQQKLAYMHNEQPGVPSPGSTGNVAYAGGMMNIFSGGNGANSVPTAREMKPPADMTRDWSPRALLMRGTSPNGSGSSSTSQTPKSGSGSSNGGTQNAGIGPQISSDIANKIMMAIQMDSRRRY